MGVTAGVLQVAQTAGTFMAQRQQSGAVRDAAGFNTSIADLQARDAVQRGAFEAGQRGIAGKQAIGAQRVAAAGSGVDVNSGSALDLQSDEARFSALDQQTIRNNAARQAWGYRAQDALNAQGATNQANAIDRESYNTLLTGATKTYGIYSNNRNSAPTPSLQKMAVPSPIRADSPRSSNQRLG